MGVAPEKEPGDAGPVPDRAKLRLQCFEPAFRTTLGVLGHRHKALQAVGREPRRNSLVKIDPGTEPDKREHRRCRCGKQISSVKRLPSLPPERLLDVAP